jgi:hypothetical protein
LIAGIKTTIQFSGGSCATPIFGMATATGFVDRVMSSESFELDLERAFAQ